MFVKRTISVWLAVIVMIGAYAGIAPSFSAEELYDDNTPIPYFSNIEVIDGGVRFTWEPFVNENCPDGVFYRVYYKNAQGDWVRMITTASTQFVDLDVHIGKSYTYTIRCVTPDGMEFASDCDTRGWPATYFDAPAVTATIGKVTGSARTGTETATDDAQSGEATDTVSSESSDEDKQFLQSGTAVNDDDTTKDETTVQPTQEEAEDEIVLKSKGDSDLAPTAAAPAVRRDIISWKGTAPSYRVYRKYLNEPDKLEVLCEDTTDLTYTCEYDPEDDAVYAYKVCALDRYGEVASACGVTPYYTQGDLYCTRNRWIYELLSAKIDGFDDTDFSDLSYAELSDAAHEYGVLTPTGYFNDGTSLTRRFTADTLVNLFGYTAHSLGNTYNTPGNSTVNFTRVSADNYYASDTTYPNINTVAYYGWFTPDIYNRLYLYNDVTADEWDHLMTDLSLYKTWHGKTVISFGDSGMQGRGNIVYSDGGVIDSTYRDINRNDFVNKRFPRYDEEMMEGPVEFIGEKYGMIHRDYSWSGAPMGTELEKDGNYYIFTNYATYKCHIANQVRTAIKENQSADLVILNGGDNDESYPSIPYNASTPSRLVYDWGYSAPDWFSSAYSRDFHYENPEYFHYGDQKVMEDYSNETSFVAGTNMTFDLVQKTYSSAPVIYVRSHQIDYGSLQRQRMYQEKVLSLAADHGIHTVDLFNNSDLDGFNKRMAAKFCYDGFWSDGSVDDSGVHPNGLGYSMHYLPHIEKVMEEL